MGIATEIFAAQEFGNLPIGGEPHGDCDAIRSQRALIMFSQ